MAVTRFPNKTSNSKEEKKMETSVIAAPASAPRSAPISLQKQISTLLDRLGSLPVESPEHAAAAKEFDQLIWGA